MTARCSPLRSLRWSENRSYLFITLGLPMRLCNVYTTTTQYNTHTYYCYYYWTRTPCLLWFSNISRKRTDDRYIMMPRQNERADESNPWVQVCVHTLCAAAPATRWTEILVPAGRTCTVRRNVIAPHVGTCAFYLDHNNIIYIARGALGGGLSRGQRVDHMLYGGGGGGDDDDDES